MAIASFVATSHSAVPKEDATLLTFQESPTDPAPADSQSSAKVAERTEFLSHLRLGRFRMNNQVVRLPSDVYVAVREGRVRDAASALLESGRGGSLDAYEALEILLIPCIRAPGFEQHRAAKRARDHTAALERAATLQVPPEITERLEWAFEADAAEDARVRAELCTGDGEKEVAGWREESRRAMSRITSEMPPDLQPQLRTARPEDRVALLGPWEDAMNHRLSEAGLTSARRAEAGQMLQSENPELRSRGLRLLRELSVSYPWAKIDVASCIRRRCVPNFGDDEEALRLTVEAAREGNDSALMRLANTRTDPSALPPSPIGLPASEHYAWATVTAQLMTDGCFGTNYFIAWTTTTPARLGLNLLEMSPAEASQAKVRAREMLATELPRIRVATACE